jgi:hypothetical protein
MTAPVCAHLPVFGIMFAAPRLRATPSRVNWDNIGRRRPVLSRAAEMPALFHKNREGCGFVSVKGGALARRKYSAFRDARVSDGGVDG